MSRRLVPLMMGLALASAARAEDWPQWRGPKRDGVSAEKGLRDRWKPAPPLVRKAEGLGHGYAGVAVDGGIVCTMGNRNGKPAVIAVSDKDGKEIWGTEIGDAGGGHSSAMCTPTIDGERVY